MNEGVAVALFGLHLMNVEINIFIYYSGYIFYVKLFLCYFIKYV